MKVSILSDEISLDPTTACEITADWGLQHLEFRLWMQHRAPRGMSEADMSQVRRVADDFGIDFPSISPGLFKLCLDDPAYADHTGDFQSRCFDLAEALGSSIIVLFPPLCASYEEWTAWPEYVVNDLRTAAENAAQRGLKLALENEPACYGGSGQTLASLLAAINHPNMYANWDPGNHTHATHEDFRAGYEALKPYYLHTHVKDYTTAGSVAIPPGQGNVDWPGQLRALQNDGYEGLLVLETHFTPKIAGSHMCYQSLCQMLHGIGEEAE